MRPAATKLLVGAALVVAIAAARPAMAWGGRGDFRGHNAWPAQGGARLGGGWHGGNIWRDHGARVEGVGWRVDWGGAGGGWREARQAAPRCRRLSTNGSAS